MTEAEYMRMALALAEKGAGFVNPNPLVGAVIVRDGAVIGRGWHERYGGLHAERNALQDCGWDARGAALYVTLEPCCHYGKTPPCTEAILESGISRVVVGCLDPNPLVAGQGVEILRQAGVEVVTGVLEAECRRLNEIFFHYIRTKTPYVILKYAMTMDGKIATCTGASRWITGEAAREHVHQTRNRCAGILVGVGTVLADDPQLTCRIEGGRNPVRIICDSHLRTPEAANVVRTAREVRTILATSCTDEARQRVYTQRGCEVLLVPEAVGHLDLRALMKTLGAMGIDSVLIEGGAALNFSALQSGIVQKVQAYIAPKLFGGASAKSPVGGAGIAEVAQCVRLKNPSIQWFGDDILIESEVDGTCSQES